MTDHWPLAISTGCCTAAPLADVLASLVQAGAARIEIGTPRTHFDPADHMHPWQVAHTVGQFPLGVVSMHAPFGVALDLASESWDYRHAGIAAALASARTLVRHPGAVVVVHPSDLRRDDVNTSARLRDAVESLLHIDHGCRALGVRLAVETPLPHLVGGHPDELRWLLDRLPSGVGVCLDTGHAHLARLIDAFVDVAGARLMHVHMHDNGGTHDDHLIPGEGAIDWCAFFDALRRVEYAGALVMELSCSEPSEAYFRKALAASRGLCHRHLPHLLRGDIHG